MIKLPEVIYKEIVRKLRTEKEVYFDGLGTFHVTRYVKKTHPKLTFSKKDGEFGTKFIKNKKCILVAFKPDQKFKELVQG